MVFVYVHVNAQFVGQIQNPDHWLHQECWPIYRQDKTILALWL